MKRTRIAALAAMVAASALLVTACSSSTEDTASDTAESTPKSIGIVTFSGTDAATNEVVKAATDAAEAKGWKVTSIDANGQLEQANSAMQNLVTSKVDAILVTIFPTDSLGAGLAATQEAEIPVISEGGGPGAGVAVDYDVALGQPMFDLMVEDMGGAGEVLNLTYQGGRPCRMRADVVETGAAALPDLNVTSQETPIPGFAEAAISATTAWIAANPAGNSNQSIFACFDGTALPAINTLIGNGREGVNVYSFNGTPPGIQAVQDGTMRATMWFDFAGLGVKMVEVLPAVWEAGASYEPQSLEAVYTTVTKENVDQFLTEHPDAAND